MLLAPLLFAANLDWVTQLGGRIERNARGDAVAVNLRGAWVADSDLESIAALPAVERLDLSLTRVTDLGMLRLKNLKTVREINLFFAELVTDEGLAAMKTWPKIERLNLRGTKVTDNTLALLAGKDSIVALDIGYAEVTDSGLQHLSKLKNLRELAIGGNKMTDVGLEVLRSMPQLTRLDISGRQRTDSGLWFVAVTDPGLDPVATLAGLRELNLAATQITSRGVRKLASLDKLEKLNLYGVKRVTDEAIGSLASLAALKWIDLKDSGITAQGFAALAKARPELVIAGDPARETVDRYKTELESTYARVVRANYGPREKSAMHEHSDTPAVVYLYLTDGGPMRVTFDDGHKLERPPVRAGEMLVAPGGRQKHGIENLTDQPCQYVRVEILTGQPQKLTGDQHIDPVTPGAADNFQKVVFDNAQLRLTRLACPSRGSCPANEFTAVDVQLVSGASQLLRRGSPARFNEAPLPLDLMRVEFKTQPLPNQ